VRNFFPTDYNMITEEQQKKLSDAPPADYVMELTWGKWGEDRKIPQETFSKKMKRELDKKGKPISHQ